MLNTVMKGEKVMRYNVMIFPAGTEIGLEIHNALKMSKFVNVFGASSIMDHSMSVYKNIIFPIPFFNENHFIEEINVAIERNNIDYIYPARDDVQLFLMQNRDKIHCKIVSSPLETVEICRSKLKTYHNLITQDFIPKLYSNINEIVSYPVFFKPSVGEGSNGVRKVNSREELSDKDFNNQNVICEYLPSMEYTIDCFTDKNGFLKIIKMRDRSRIKAGISVHSKIMETDKQIEYIANALNGKFDFVGAWFFQVKKDACGNYKLMEVSPRIPGTMGLSRNCGINFPLLTLYTFESIDVDIIDNNYEIELDRAFINRYSINIKYDYVYVDLDDTLIVDNKVNQFLIMFLYQAKNKGKKLILLTRHKENPQDTLKKFSISEMLFDGIIHINMDDKKSDYISESKAIFIDDSFAERKDVKEKQGIPVFDLDMIESLIDWRI